MQAQPRIRFTRGTHPTRQKVEVCMSLQYANLKDVAAERGEEPAKVARQLVQRGCDLWL